VSCGEQFFAVDSDVGRILFAMSQNYVIIKGKNQII